MPYVLIQEKQGWKLSEFITFSDRKTTLSSSLMLRKRLKWHFCEAGMEVVKRGGGSPEYSFKYTFLLMFNTLFIKWHFCEAGMEVVKRGGGSPEYSFKNTFVLMFNTLFINLLSSTNIDRLGEIKIIKDFQDL